MNNFVIRGINFCEIPEVKSIFNISQNNPHHVFDVGNHSLKSAQIARDNNEDDIIIAVMMLHDIGKAATKTTDTDGIDHFFGHAKESVKIVKNIFKRIGIFSDDEIKDIIFLIKYHHFNFNDDNIKNFKKDVPIELLKKLIKVKTYDVLAQSEYMRKEKFDEINKFKKLIEED